MVTVVLLLVVVLVADGAKAAAEASPAAKIRDVERIVLFLDEKGRDINSKSETSSWVVCVEGKLWRFRDFGIFNVYKTSHITGTTHAASSDSSSCRLTDSVLIDAMDKPDDSMFSLTS